MTIVNKKTEEFYATLKQWWEGHNFPILKLDFLPEETFVCYNGHLAIYAICFYHTDSKLCWIAFPVSNPFVGKGTKEKGLVHLINGVSEYAKQAGFNYIFTTSPLPRVQDGLLESGFRLGDEGANHYLKIIT